MKIIGMRLVKPCDLPESYESQFYELESQGVDQNLLIQWADYVSKKSWNNLRGRTTDAHRDSFKTKVYKSEWEFERIWKSVGEWKTFKDGKEAQKYTNKILKSKTWEKIKSRLCFADAGVHVSSKKLGGRIAGTAYMDRIILNEEVGMNEYTLLHELAHVAGYMHHDLSFRQALIALVSRFMGREAAKILKACFKKQGLQMKRSTKIMDFEQWVKMKERMDKARAAKKAA